MFIKIFFLLILLISSKQDDRPQIKILEVKDPKCSDSLGRVDFTAKYKHTSLKDMNSYFLLFFKDQNNKKRSSICHLSYSQSGDQPENGTVISDTVYPPESQEIVEPTGGSVTDIVEPTTPITPTTDIPTSEEGESDTSKEGDQGEDTSKEGDQEGESDTSKEGDQGEDTSKEGDQEGESDTSKEGDQESDTSKEGDQESDTSKEGEQESDTSIETEESNSIKSDEPESEYDPDDELLKQLLVKFRLQLEDNFKYDVKELDKLHDLRTELKFLLNYDLTKKLKLLLVDVDEMEIKLANFTERFVLEPLDKSILKLQKLVDFNLTELKLNINESVCSFQQEFLKTFSNEGTLIFKLKEDIKELKGKNFTQIYETKKEDLKDTFDEFKKKTDEKLNSTILNDLLDKISQINANISVKIDESIGNVSELVEKAKAIYEDNKNSTLVEKVDKLNTKIQTNILDAIVVKLDKSMTDFNNELVGNLTEIQVKVEKLKELKDANKTELAEKLKEDIKKKVEELQKNVSDYMEGNKVLKPVKDKLEELKGNITDKIEEKGLKDKINAYKKEIKDYEDLLEKLKQDGKDKLNETKYDAIKKLGEINGTMIVDTLTYIPNKRLERLEQLKNLTLVLSTFDKLKRVFNSSNAQVLFDKNYNKTFEFLDKLNKDKDAFLGDDTTLTLTKEKIKELQSKLKAKAQKAGLDDSLVNNLYNTSLLNKALKDQIKKQLDIVNETIYKVEDKLKLDEINRTDILEKIHSLDEPFKALPNVELTLKNIKDKLNNTDWEKVKADLQKELKDLKDKLDKSALLAPLIDKIKEIETKLNQTGLIPALDNHIDALKGLNETLLNLTENLKLNNKAKLQELVDKVEAKIKAIDGKKITKELQELEKNLTSLVQKLQEVQLNKDSFKALKTEIENYMNGKPNLKPILDELKKIDQKITATGLPAAFKDHIDAIKEIKDSLKMITIYQLNDTIYYLASLINATDIVTKLNELDLKPNVTLKDYQDLVEPLIKNNTYLSPILQDIKDLKIQIDKSNLSIALTDYNISIKEIDDALNNLAKLGEQDLNKTMYKIKEEIEKINGTEILLALEPFKNETLLKELLKEQKDKLNAKLDELKKNDTVLKPVLEKYDKVKADVTLLLKDSGVVDAFKEYNNSIIELGKALKNLNDDEKKELRSKLNATLSNEIEKIMLKIQNYNRTQRLNELAEEIDLVLANISYVFNSPNATIREARRKEVFGLAKKDIQNKINELKKKSKLLDKLLANIDLEDSELKNATKNYILSVQDLIKTLPKLIEKPNLNLKSKLNETYYNITEKIKEKLTFNSTELIIKLNTSLFEMKDEIIDDINNKTKYELIHLEIRNAINGTMIDVLNKTGNLKNFKKVMKYLHQNNISSKIENIKLKIKKINTTKIIKELNASLYSCNIDFVDKLASLDEIKPALDKIKNLFNNTVPANFTRTKEVLTIILQDLNNETNVLFGRDERFKLFKKKVDELNQTAMNVLTKMGLEEDLKKVKDKIQKMKDRMNKLKDDMDKLSLNQTIYKLKSKSKQLNIKEILEKANQTLKDAKEDLNNLREIDYNAAKVKYILESANLTGLTEEQMGKVKKLLADSKDKAHSLNYKLLEKIIDKLNELNNNLTDQIDVNEIHKKVDDFLTDCENLEKKIEKFPNSTEELRFNASYNKVKDLKPKDLYPILDQMDDFIQKRFEKVNETGALFSSIFKLIGQKFRTLPKDSDPDDLDKRVNELFKETAKELKENLQELVKDTRIEVYQDKIKEINVKVDEIIKNNTELIEFVEFFKNKSDILDEKLKNMTDSFEGKTLNEIIEQIRQTIKNMNIENAIRIRREFLKMLFEASPIYDIFNTTALEKLKKRIDQLDNLPKLNKTKIKEQIEDIISKLKKLREYINNDNVESISPSLKSINLVTLLEELRKIDTSKMNIEEEINKVKRLKALLDEMNTILDSSAGKAVLEALIRASKLRNLSVKKAKKAKKTKKFRRADEEKEDYLTCKIDDSFVNSPSNKQLVANSENINSKILLVNENYDVYVDDNLQLDLEESETNCGYDSVTQTKGNITYIRHTTPYPDYDKNRVVYDLYAKIDDNYKYPNFFYIMTKTKVKYNSSNVEKEEELDSYCVLEDDNDRDNARFKCYAYTENMTSFSEADDDIKSSYIIIADSNSTEPDNGDNGKSGKSGTYFNRKKSSGGLGAGAIVGIILACLAVLIAIICTIVCLNKRASTAAVVARQSESNNHIQISSMSGQYPVKV